MFYFISLLTGALISVMVAANGGLTARNGVYAATVIIHIVGLIVIGFVLWVRRERPFRVARQPFFLYLGGVIGVATTALLNLSFGRISVSAILALGLLGQSAAGLAIDRYGWLGMPKRPLHRHSLIGMALILCGIAAMLTDFDPLAVLCSFAAGVTIVVARTLNARFSDASNLYLSTFYNYLIGLCTAILVFLLLGRGEPSLTDVDWTQLYLYAGGVLGVCVVVLSNATVMKISAVYCSLLLFIGQAFAGVLLDAVLTQAFSLRILIGGTLAAVGLCVNLLLDAKRAGTTGVQPSDL